MAFAGRPSPFRVLPWQAIDACAETAHARLEGCVQASQALRTAAAGAEWLRVLCFTPLRACSHGGLTPAELMPARRVVEARAAEEAANKLFDDDSHPKGHARATSACEGADADGGKNADARRRKKERQQQRKREARGEEEARALDAAVEPKHPSAAGPATATHASAAGAAADDGGGGGGGGGGRADSHKVGDPDRLISPTISATLDEIIGAAVATSIAGRRARQAKARLRQRAVAEAEATLERIVGLAVRDALRRGKKREKAELRKARQVSMDPGARVAATGTVSSGVAGSARPVAESAGAAGSHGGVSSGSVADWMTAAVDKLLMEME